MKKLDNILKGFQKTVRQLEALAKLNDAKVDTNAGQIRRLQEDNLELMGEAQAARNAAANIRKILED